MSQLCLTENYLNVLQVLVGSQVETKRHQMMRKKLLRLRFCQKLATMANATYRRVLVKNFTLHSFSFNCLFIYLFTTVIVEGC
jgi:hypothetical protein